MKGEAKGGSLKGVRPLWDLNLNSVGGFEEESEGLDLASDASPSDCDEDSESEEEADSEVDSEEVAAASSG